MGKWKVGFDVWRKRAERMEVVLRGIVARHKGGPEGERLVTEIEALLEEMERREDAKPGAEY